MPTYALVSAIWQSVLSFGVWFGSTISGVMVEYFGFRQSCWLFLSTSFTMVNPCVMVNICKALNIIKRINLLQAGILGGYMFLKHTPGFGHFSSNSTMDKSEILQFGKSKEAYSTYGVVNLEDNFFKHENLFSL